MADKTIGELPNLPAISPLDLLVAQHNEEATKVSGATLTNFFKDYIGPVAATSASQMTNTNKVYIYIGNESGYTNGNWYYYNGSTWVSGGAYNSQAVNTDATLTHEGVPADAEAAGKIVEISETQPAAPANRVWIPETQEATVQVPTWAEHEELANALAPLKTAPALTSSDDLNDLYGTGKSGFYYLGANVQNAPTNYAGLLCITNANGESFQYVIGAYKVIAFRCRTGNPQTWSEWTDIYGEVRNAVRVITDEPLTSSDDLNNYVTTGLYRIGATTPQNCPTGITWNQLMVTIIGSTRLQTIFNATSSGTTIWQRIGNTSAWQSWQSISSSDIATLRTDVNTAITQIANAPISISEQAASNFTLIANNVIKKNNIVMGLLVFRVDTEWSARNNTTMCIFGSGWKPTLYQMCPAFITASQWENTGDAANLAYINTSGYMVMNWASAIPVGKYIKVNVNFTV